MAAKDIYHDVVATALMQDGWTITHDPLTLDVGTRQLYVDLGAERLIAANRQDEKIAVEVKSFIAPSVVSEFHTALGQFLNYRLALRLKEPERTLYLAVPMEVYQDFFRDDLAQLSLQEYAVKLIVFDPELEEISQWLP